MGKMKDTKKQETNGNGTKPECEYLPKDYEVDESPAAKAFMKAVRMTRKRLYPELYEAKKKNV